MLCEIKALARQEGLHSEVVLTVFGLGAGGLAVGPVPGKSCPLLFIHLPDRHSVGTEGPEDSPNDVTQPLASQILILR